MPRLVKGGKHVYDWSEVVATGKIAVPEEAITDYNLKTSTKVILWSGSRRSGGFALTTVALLKNSRLSAILDESSQLAGFQLPEGATVTIARKPCC